MTLGLTRGSGRPHPHQPPRRDVVVAPGGSGAGPGGPGPRPLPGAQSRPGDARLPGGAAGRGGRPGLHEPHARHRGRRPGFRQPCSAGSSARWAGAGPSARPSRSRAACAPWRPRSRSGLGSTRPGPDSAVARGAMMVPSRRGPTTPLERRHHDDADRARARPDRGRAALVARGRVHPVPVQPRSRADARRGGVRQGHARQAREGVVGGGGRPSRRPPSSSPTTRRRGTSWATRSGTWATIPSR